MLEIMGYFARILNWIDLPDGAIVVLWIALFWLPLTRITFYWLPRKFRQIKLGH